MCNQREYLCSPRRPECDHWFLRRPSDVPSARLAPVPESAPSPDWPTSMMRAQSDPLSQTPPPATNETCVRTVLQTRANHDSPDHREHHRRAHQRRDSHRVSPCACIPSFYLSCCYSWLAREATKQQTGTRTGNSLRAHLRVHTLRQAEACNTSRRIAEFGPVRQAHPLAP